MSYNHHIWPSPRAKIVAQKLRLDYTLEPTKTWFGAMVKTKIKRLTHAQALELLRKRAGKATVEEFLAMSRQDAWFALGCYTSSVWNGANAVYDPLYGPNPKYKPRNHY